MEIAPKYEILNSLPVYGPMYLPISVDGFENYSDGFVVKFFKSDQSEWVANFQAGCTDFYIVRTFNECDLILVIAGGTCYLMHPDDQKPKKTYDLGYKSILEMENGGFVLENSFKLTIFYSDASYWSTERISWDGIVDLKLNNNLLTGLSYDPTADDDLWIEFSINLNSREIVGGSYLKSFTNKKMYKKAWWKFWIC